MQANWNTIRVTAELTTILFGLPALGLITCIVLWVWTKREPDPNKQQYQRLGFAAACFAFAVPLLIACLTAKPAAALTHSLAFLLPLLLLAGIFASLTAAVALAVNARGIQRVAGPFLCLIGFAYSVFTIFAALAGGGGY